MDNFSIDINCDLGEGLGNDAALIPLISSCNIACGGHAGNIETMSEVSRLAEQYNVRVGAHPSYPDRKNFGRVSMNIPESELIKSIRKQMDDFMAILKKDKIKLHHIKPHGALYNDIAKNTDLAKTFLKAIADFKEEVLVYVPYKSVIEEKAFKDGFKIRHEAFADRNYNSDLSLVSRKIDNAVIQEPRKVLNHLVGMVKDQTLTTLDGHKIQIQADTYCVHGDTPSALKILKYLTQELPKQNIRIEK